MMAVADLFVPLGVFAMLTLMVALVLRLFATAMLHKTIREALRNDPATVPLLVAKLEARQPWADALLGWIFLAFAAALVGLALFADRDEQRMLLQAAVIPVVVGATVLLYVRLARPRTPMG
jgi:hypothetical protein